MASNGAIPPPIPEVSGDLKFDGGVKVGWAPIKRRIINSLKTQGLLGYTNGNILKPASPAMAVTTPAGAIIPLTATPVFSMTPSLEEWTFRNDQAKGIIESHIDDLPSLMPKVDDKSAKEVFEELENEFAKKDGMHKVLTK